MHRAFKNDPQGVAEHHLDAYINMGKEQTDHGCNKSIFTSRGNPHMQKIHLKNLPHFGKALSLEMIGMSL